MILPPLMISARKGDFFPATSWADGIRPYDFDLEYELASA